jgi:hypothetical protein
MVRLFDTTFIVGALLVIAALVIAIAALTRESLPIIGVGRGALVAVAIAGMAGCAVAGISQASSLGWTDTMILLGSVLGVVALLVVAAGLFGWDGVLQPVAGFVPSRAGDVDQTVRVAIAALSAVIGLKWVIGIAMAAFARQS